MSGKGDTWDFDGYQLTYGWALALCYHVGFRGGNRLRTAVAVMTAESQRWTRAWHHNRNDKGEIVSTDRGLYQINDKAHPQFPEEWMWDPIRNAGFAYRLSAGGNDFRPWAAYNSGAYLRFMPIVFGHWLVGRWRFKLDRVEKYMGRLP